MSTLAEPNWEALARHPQFRELVSRWEADYADRQALDGEIRRAAAELFGPADTGHRE